MHSFLLMGQSNMAGRGQIAQAKSIDSKGIYLLRNGMWQPFFRPVSFDGKGAGVCLAESFAEGYVRKHGTDTGLIACAVGGTSISQWKKGGALFDNALYQVELARRSSEIQGILWHQGECDTAPEKCEVYEDEFDSFVKAFRKEARLENVPFIAGELGAFLQFHKPDPRQKNYPLINKAIKNVVSKNENMGLASADGLTANEDNLHFNSHSLYELGLRYLEEYERVKCGK